jgi:hypothetical protein
MKFLSPSEEEAREKEAAGKEKEESPQNPMKGLAEAFSDLNKLFKNSENLVWWCSPVIPATRETEVEGLLFKAGLGKSTDTT